MQNAIIPKTAPSLNHPIAVNQRKAPQLLIPCPSWLNPAPDPSASSVKPLRFAPMNAHPAGLTARTDMRLPPPRRAFAFHAPLRVARRAKPNNAKERQNANRTSRAVFPARQFRQGVPPTVGERTRPMVRSSTVGTTRFRPAERCEGDWHRLRG